MPVPHATLRAQASAPLLLIVFLSFGLLPGAMAWASPWMELETRHTVIRYQNPGDLKAFDRQIRFGSTRLFPAETTAEEDSSSSDKAIADKIDLLFRRVQEILDMHKRMDRVGIEIYPDKTTLQAAYVRFFQTPGKYRAWYLFETNTVHLTAEDVHEGMLAHELAHAIIDHYFAVKPPAATAEILAGYVDKHLKR